MEIAEGIRSLLARYGFKEPGDILIRAYSNSMQYLLLDQQTVTKALGGKYVGTIEITHSSAGALPPKGFALRSISMDAAFYLKISGRVNFRRRRPKGNEAWWMLRR